MNNVVAVPVNLVIRISIGIVSSVNSVCIKWLSVRICPDLAKSGDNKIFTGRFCQLLPKTVFTSSFNTKLLYLPNLINYFQVNRRNNYYFHLIKQIHSRYIKHNTIAMGHMYKIRKFTCYHILRKRLCIFL